MAKLQNFHGWVQQQTKIGSDKGKSQSIDIPVWIAERNDENKANNNKN
jgi:hypothetical protein